jgi:salicylate hydroxylase
MTRVAIVGGGIGGLTAAAALSQVGVEVCVYEAAAELKEIGAGVALHANAMRVLRAIGVEDAVRKVAGRSQFAVTRNGITGRVISKTSREQQAAVFGIEGATVHRADLLDVLAQALPDGIVTLGKRCTQARTEGEVAVARFADGTEAEADVVIGADGIHSAVRAALFGPDAPRFTGKVCYRSVIPAAAISGVRGSSPGVVLPGVRGSSPGVVLPGVRGSSPGSVLPGVRGSVADNGQWLGPHGTIVLYPLRGGELINVVCHYDDDGYRHESWVTECERQEVLDRYAGWHESLLGLFAAGETWYKWALYDREPIPVWTLGRVSLLGDAAHPMLPYLGQGACQALEDGAVLATALTAEAGDAVSGLRRYEAIRRPRASRVVLTARERGRSNHLPSRWAALRRDASIAIRRRLNRRDPEGRGTAWLAGYDATTPDALAASE